MDDPSFSFFPEGDCLDSWYVASMQEIGVTGLCPLLLRSEFSLALARPSSLTTDDAAMPQEL